jgi:nitrite reductase (NO-forming)
MPNQGLSDAEVKDYLAYFRWADANVQPQGTRQPQPAAAGSALPPSQTLSATPMQPGTSGTQRGQPMEHK